MNRKDMSKKAELLWLKNHSPGEGWYIVRGQFRKTDKQPYVVLHAAKENKSEMRYSLQCAGNGHYFRTKKEMKSFLWKNGWATPLGVKKSEEANNLQWRRCTD